MNPNVQGPVQLAGRGLAFRPQDSYIPGEFSTLINMDITPRGTLKSRPPAQGYYPEDGSATAMGQLIGSHYSYVITAFSNARPVLGKYYSYDETDLGWAAYRTAVLAKRPTSGTDAGTGNATVTALAYFIYNNKEYLISCATYNPTGTTDSVAYIVVSNAPHLSPVQPNLWSAHTVGDPVFSNTETNAYAAPAWQAYYANNVRFPQFMILDWLLDRDRLWLISEDTVYFSMATDPTVFTVPSGGFFKFPNANLKSIDVIGQTIYVVADSSISTIVYDSDPNTNPEVSLISDRIGGEDSTVLGDTLYVVKPNALYAVLGNNITKIRDLEVFLDRSDSYRCTTTDTTVGSFSMKLEAWDNSLFIIPRVVRQQFVASSPYDVFYSKYYNDGNAVISSNTIFRYFIDLDFLTSYNFGSNGHAVDALYVPNEDVANQTKVVFLGSDSSNFDIYAVRMFSIGNRPRWPVGFTTPNKPVFNDAVISQQIGLDLVWHSGVTTSLSPELPMFTVVVQNFSPDNLRYMIKKIRSVELELLVPLKHIATSDYDPCLQLNVYAGDDGGSYFGGLPEASRVLDTYISLLGAASNNPVYSETHRYGINQRCKRITFEFNINRVLYTSLAPAGTAVGTFVRSGQWEVTDLRTLWTYSGRGPVNNTLGA